MRKGEEDRMRKGEEMEEEESEGERKEGRGGNLKRKSRRERGGGGGNSTEGKERSNWGKLERASHWHVEWQLTILLYHMYVYFPYIQFQFVSLYT